MKTSFLILFLLPIAIGAIFSDEAFVLTDELPNELSPSTDVKQENLSLQSQLGKSRTVGSNPDKSIIGSGLIGTSVRELRENYSNLALERNDSCKWYGTSPFCSGQCPIGLVETVSSQHPFWMSTTFGSSCWTGSKSFCCDSSITKRRWAGRWKNSLTGKDMWCAYSSESGLCGSLKCYEEGKPTSSQITGGSKCDEVTLFGRSGRANGQHIYMDYLQKDGYYGVFEYFYYKYADF